jgi:hypothetical protein
MSSIHDRKSSLQQQPPPNYFSGGIPQNTNPGNSTVSMAGRNVLGSS